MDIHFKKIWTKHKEFILLTGMVSMIIIIISLQDYYAAKWNHRYYDFNESMAFKVFWLLFIPFFFLHKKIIESTHRIPILNTTRLKVVLFSVGLPILTGLLHLFLFAYFLSVFSPLFSGVQWDLGVLIREKLTTRLYIVWTVYLIFSYLEYKRQKASMRNNNFNGSFTIKNGRLTTILNKSDIKWIKADGGYLELQIGDKKHVIVDSLRNILENLDPDQFKRIHKSTIVNLHMIKAFKSRNNGDYDVLLNDGTSLRLSRNYVKPIKELMF